MGLSKTPAIVLKSRKWGDADRIVTFFTLKHGKVRGVARGARRMKSRFGSALEPCNSCQSTATDRWFFSPRAGGTLCGPCARHEPVRCALISPASLAFFRQALRMDPALLPRLKATAPVREELRDAIELYVDYVAGRSLPKSGVLFAAERRSTYRRTPSPVASGNANRV